VSLERARSLKPELEYNFGESLSVYLFPDWDNETFYLQKELDLEGIALIDLPWMLNSKATFIPELPTKRSRDFASGFDAYDIALLISNPSSSNYFKYIGMTGELVYKNGKLVRKSLKAEIQNGHFKVIGY
jgi:outer membrane PBP1 activator LpoA protein